ncbi:MAG TPA: rod shape-determining protein MreC [Candidatus Paceibacterota bacterium]|nr:rod shape-determining protein MreC [Candidatus Paceibacterota bacterium]
MRKTYFGRRNALIPRGTAIVGGVFVLVAVVVLVLRVALPGVLVSVAAPLWQLSAAAESAFHAGTVSFASPAKLQSELDAATAENVALTNQNKTLAAQIIDLQKLLGSRSDVPPALLASVIARPPESPYDTLVVDQGSHATVAPEALVTGPGGVPVGKVASVNASSARVTLFSAPGVSTDAWAGQNRLPITLTGAGSGAFEASVPKDANIVVGDSIYIANNGAAAMGTVVRVDSDPSSTSATLRIQPVVNPFSLTWVLIARS